MSDLSALAQYNILADLLIKKASKEDIAECASMLAMNVAHYKSKFGVLPVEETLAMLEIDQPDEGQLKIMIDGMETLVGMLGQVVSGIGQEKH
jgi:hypothetical protein